ncbi:MAG: serine protease, partial [Thermoleophilales bacterium]|nr:serine protease [Thermoleophilales bacterium]
MRGLGATVAVLVGLLLAAPGASAAVTCTYAPSAYSSAGSPGGPPANDPLFPRQWGLTQIKAPAAWGRGARGAGATIAVIDTGADLTHPDLQANLVPGADFVPGGGACDGPQDENGHGTHTAGIAAAVTNNGVGVAGTAPDAKVMPLRALDDAGSGEDAWIIAAIKYAADNGAKVINMSLGGMVVVGQVPQLNQELEDAVKYAWDKGVVVVASAGNDSFPLCGYPAAARYAICVGATDRRGAPSAYSNFPNDPDQTVGVRAPGGAGSPFCEDDEDIWSTVWPGSSFDCKGTGSLTGYDTIAGTSMAAPYAAGVAALLSGQGLTNAQIMECIKKTSSNKGAYDPVMGYG